MIQRPLHSCLMQIDGFQTLKILQWTFNHQSFSTGTGSSQQIFLSWDQPCKWAQYIRRCTQPPHWSWQADTMDSALMIQLSSGSSTLDASFVMPLLSQEQICWPIIKWHMDSFLNGFSDIFIWVWSACSIICKPWQLRSQIKISISCVKFSSSASSVSLFSLMVEMDGFVEMADIWGEVLPKEQLKRYLQMEDQRDGEKRHKGIKSESQSNGSGRSTQMQPQILQQLLTLVMRHEDTLRCLNLDSEFVVYFNSGQGGIVPELMKASQEWKNNKERQEPLRHCLACKMISLLHARFTKIMDAPQESDLRQNAIKYGLIDQAGKCPYLSWHKEQRKLVASKSPALTMEDTMEMLTIIKNNMEDPRVTLRFHSLQKLQEDHSRAVPFLWMVSNRIHLDLWHALQRLSHHSSLQLIQASLRPGNLQRSALARQLQPSRNSHWDSVRTSRGPAVT